MIPGTVDIVFSEVLLSFEFDSGAADITVGSKDDKILEIRYCEVLQYLDFVGPGAADIAVGSHDDDLLEMWY